MLRKKFTNCLHQHRECSVQIGLLNLPKYVRDGNLNIYMNVHQPSRLCHDTTGDSSVITTVWSVIATSRPAMLSLLKNESKEDYFEKFSFPNLIRVFASDFHNGSKASSVSRDGHYQGLMTQNGVELSWIILEMMKYIQISLSGEHFCLFVSIFALEKYANHYFRFRRV